MEVGGLLDSMSHDHMAHERGSSACSLDERRPCCSADSTVPSRTPLDEAEAAEAAKAAAANALAGRRGNKPDPTAAEEAQFLEELYRYKLAAAAAGGAPEGSSDDENPADGIGGPQCRVRHGTSSIGHSAVGDEATMPLEEEEEQPRDEILLLDVT